VANIKVKDHDANARYLKATGAGTDLDPHVTEHESVQGTHDDLNCNANLQVGDADVGGGNPVPVSDAGGSLTVDNAALAVVGGGAEASALRVTLASDSTGVVSVDDNGGSITIDGAVTVGDGGTALEVQGDAAEDAAAAGNPILAGGRYDATPRTLDDGDVGALALDADGALQVSDGGDSLTVDNAALAVVGGGVEASALRVTLASDSTGVVSVDDNGGSITIDGAVDIGSALPAGANQIGSVIVDDIEDGAGDSVMDAVNDAIRVNVVAGSGSGVSHVDDAAFTVASDDVVPVAGVYQSSPDSVDDGDAGAVRMTAKRVLFVTHETPNGDSMVDDGNDALKVNVVAGSGSGVSHVDDAPFSVGSDDVVPIAGVFDDTSPDSVDEDDAGAVRMSGNRNLYVQVRDAAGNERGLNVDASGNIGVTDAGGALTIDGAVTVGDGGTALEVQGDAAEDAAAAGNPVLAGGRYDATPRTLDDGDVGALALDADGALQVSDGGNSLTVDNAALAVVGGGVEASALRVTLASDSTGVVSVDDNGGSLTVDGTVAVSQAPATSGGYTIYRDIDLDETGISVKGSAGQIYGWFMHNKAASTLYVKFYNSSGAPTVGTDTPILTIPIPAGASANVEFLGGIACSSGIGIGCTTGVADNDTGAPGANEMIVNVFYK